MQCASGAGGNGLIDRTPSAADDQHLARLDVAHVGRADQIHRAGLRADDVRVAEPAERERPEPVRIADGDQPILASASRARTRPAPARPTRRSRPRRVARLRPRVEVQDDLGVAARLEDRALPHELVAQLARVDEVAVVADRDLAVRAVDQDRLRVEQLALAGRRVADVADRRSARQRATASRRRRCRRRSPSRARRAPAAPSDAAMPALSCPRCCSA